ncbi:hypothetical protein BKA65DRAFT_294745 [Rhexocercosporidium sp. MPI-PUGE-AT-0058]|nr:hypothetical protein BKA65DRAFT_294745 [Rhexocercosporidium sp. MPI-PUGE-AT-0058]
MANRGKPNSRARRVKCDERVPVCTLCSRIQRPCVWKRTQPNSRRPLLPQDTVQLRQVKPSETLRFVNQDEALYFRAYQDEACLELSRYNKSSAWSYTLLQACYHKPFVLRAVVAIGAFNKSVKQGYFAVTGPLSERKTSMEIANRHQTFALASYHRAIVGMQQIVPVPQDPSSLRNALLACLVIYCIELLLKSPTTALNQGQNGYLLLQQWSGGKDTPNAGLSSPNSSIVDDEIFHEYGRIELYHAIRWGVKDLTRHMKRKEEGAVTVKHMPTRFSFLEEARRYQQLLMRRTFHLMDESYARNIMLKQDLRHPYTADSPGELMDPCYIPTDLLPERESYLKDVRRWMKAFDLVLARCLKSEDPLAQSEAALLQIQALDAEMSLAGAFFTKQCDYDQFLPSFTQIVSLSRHVNQSNLKLWTTKSPVFNFPDSIEKPLYDTACFCRDKFIREEALAILRTTAHRDPTRQQARLATRATFIVDLEEANRLPDGTIPEDGRWRIIWILHHYQEPKNDMTIVCCRKIGYPLGEQYPAQREWKRMTFTEDEAERMNMPPWTEEIHFSSWAPKRNFSKPACISWREVHDELLGRTDRSRIS